VGGKLAASTPLGIYYCPTRRPVAAFPYIHTSPYINIDRPDLTGRTDYAGNAGDYFIFSAFGPGSFQEGDSWSAQQWESYYATSLTTGIFNVHSVVKPVQITDGTSRTYLVGERYLNADHYTDGVSCDNDQGWDLGHDFDINRWTVNDPAYQPMRDRRGYGDCNVNFGSAHQLVFNAVLCDGSTHAIRYEIDLETNRRLGCRNDRQGIDAGAWQ
jgi:hypothetical protein